MQCPDCGSENTRKLQVIYEDGTNQINTTSHTAGAGIGGALGIGGASTKTSGVSQSTLAKKLAPPFRKSMKWPVIFILLGLVLASFKAYEIAVILIAVGGIQIYLKAKYNKNEWPELYKNWSMSWHCDKCGKVYAQ